MEQVYKTCNRCDIPKPLFEFSPHPQAQYGCQPKCKKCAAEVKRIYYQNNKEKVKEQQRKHYRKNVEKYTAYNKKYWENNKEWLSVANKERYKEYQVSQPDMLKRVKRKSYMKHREARLAAQREYVSKNREMVNGRMVQWRNKNPHNRICHNLRTRLSHIAKGRANRFNVIVGCSGRELAQHLESQFKEGMSWDNYGRSGWHIDHIIPIASFDLTDPKQQKICFHYSNLQPLWAEDNMRKGANAELWNNQVMMI